jgi:ankyrin repeat protein
LGLTKVVKLVFEDVGSYSRLETPKPPWLYLARAAARGWTEHVLLLLAYGADVNAIAPKRGNNYSNKAHGTALEAAARFGHLEIAKILLAAGVNVDQQGSKQSDEQKSTESSCTFDAALSIEDRTRMKKMVRLLIDAGACVNYVLAPTIMSFTGSAGRKKSSK